jgi:hypothetical protein
LSFQLLAAALPAVSLRPAFIASGTRRFKATPPLTAASAGRATVRDFNTDAALTFREAIRIDRSQTLVLYNCLTL